MNQALPVATVIIPAYNAAITLAECLSALDRQTIDRSSFDVIVVDDGSTDKTGAIGCRSGAKVLTQPHSNPAVARNRGARAARGPILVFTDADCVAAPEWLAEMLAPFADPRVAGVKGAYWTRQRHLLARFVQAEFEDKYDRLRRPETIDFIDTYSAAYRRSIFLENGGFDESFPGSSAEDVEFSFRLATRGYRLLFNPAARTYHYHSTSLRSYLHKKFRYGVWRARVYSRYPDKAVRDSRTPRSVPVQIVTAGVTALGAPLLPSGRGRLIPLSAGLAFLTAAAPFAIRAGRRDPIVGLASPGLIFIRSLAQFAGLAAGTTGLIVGQVQGSRFKVASPKSKVQSHSQFGASTVEP